ncbi:EAL domain-containing protein [Hujiaoplasma nucleasis]|uniref:EAL domain-containing protein n=1 Tax=Hujiaoplasma nucleasis TaxID=2725268 RepID=A0A7L6N3I9_9MOLU|nr:EAL domain-containing protein [Hujiaoplasma nucleasis]QLY39788.1 EAL domain-containing protein [Hujiaoplasma nucleasis]
MKERFNKIFYHFKETIGHFGWFTLVLIPIFIIINWSFFSTSNAQRQAIESKNLSTATQELNNIDLYITTHLESVHNDIHVILEANETSKYLADSTSESLIEFRDLVYRIASNKKAFLHSSLIDSDGQEIFRITRDGESLIIEEESALRSYNQEDYFSVVSSFDHQVLFISGIELVNDIPILTLIAPVFNNDELIHFIKIDYLADSFLSVFSLYSSNNNYLSLGMLNNQKIWLIDQSSQSLYQETNSQKINEYINYIEEDPYTPSIKLNFHGDDDHYYYVLDEAGFIIFSRIDMDSAIATSQSLSLKYPWMIYIINIMSLIFIMYFAYVIKSKSADKILLNANMYLSDNNVDGVMITDKDIRVHYVNQAFESFYGYKIEELIHKNPRDVIGETGLPIDFQMREYNKYFEGHIWNKTKDDIRILKYLRIKNESTTSGKIRHYIGIYSEPRIEIDDYVKYSKVKDQTISEISKVFINYDFKIDQSMLIMVKIHPVDIYHFAKFVKRKLDKQAIIAVPKNNYLMIYLNQDKDLQEDTINQVDQLIDQYKHLPDSDHTISQTVVVSQASEKLRSISALIDSIFTVLELSKHKPQLKHHHYTNEMKDILIREKEIQEELDSAFTNKEFYIEYQIQKSLIDNSYVGCEALIRWNNKKLGMIGPNEFIPIIEDSFYINQLTIMVVQNVIDDLKKFYKSLPEGFRVSINLSNFDFNNAHIINKITEIIESSIIPNQYFAFEITESNYLDNIEKTNKILDDLHNKGFVIAIDDFGTGYSSINSLRSIHVDQVKIDKIFIENYPEKDHGQMFRTIARLIQGLNKEIIVEGTESKEQVDFCRACQCEMIQGYYVSRPTDIQTMIDRFILADEGEKNA